MNHQVTGQFVLILILLFFSPQSELITRINYLVGTVKFISQNHSEKFLSVTIKKKIKKLISTQHLKWQDIFRILLWILHIGPQSGSFSYRCYFYHKLSSRTVLTQGLPDCTPRFWISWLSNRFWVVSSSPHPK